MPSHFNSFSFSSSRRRGSWRGNFNFSQHRSMTIRVVLFRRFSLLLLLTPCRTGAEKVLARPFPTETLLRPHGNHLSMMACRLEWATHTPPLQVLLLVSTPTLGLFLLDFQSAHRRLTLLPTIRLQHPPAPVQQWKQRPGRVASPLSQAMLLRPLRGCGSDRACRSSTPSCRRLRDTHPQLELEHGRPWSIPPPLPAPLLLRHRLHRVCTTRPLLLPTVSLEGRIHRRPLPHPNP